MSAPDDYARAMSDIRRGLTARQGGGSAEVRAAQAYKAMVRDGTASPIRRKYSVGRWLKQVR